MENGKLECMAKLREDYGGNVYFLNDPYMFHLLSIGLE